MLNFRQNFFSHFSSGGGRNLLGFYCCLCHWLFHSCLLLSPGQSRRKSRVVTRTFAGHAITKMIVEITNHLLKDVSCPQTLYIWGLIHKSVESKRQCGISLSLLNSLTADEGPSVTFIFPAYRCDAIGSLLFCEDQGTIGTLKLISKWWSIHGLTNSLTSCCFFESLTFITQSLMTHMKFCPHFLLLSFLLHQQFLFFLSFSLVIISTTAEHLQLFHQTAVQFQTSLKGCPCL